MKLRKLSLALLLSATVAMSSLTAFSVQAASLIPEFDGTKVVFENPGLTDGDNHNWEGGDPSYVKSENGVMTVTVPEGVTGMYYRPNSPYGAKGAFGEGGVAMKLKLSFVEDDSQANDWGAMLLIRNTDNLSWNATKALSLQFCEDKVALFQAGVTDPLAVVYKPVKDAYYNIEFITVDHDNGKTTAYVLITDEQGNLLRNDGDEGNFTMMVDDIDTAAIPAAYISLYTNGAELQSYSMKQGEWTYDKADEDGEDEEGGEEGDADDNDQNMEEEVPYPSLDGVKCFDMSELGVTTKDGLDKYWAPVGTVDYTINDAKNLITVTPAATEGFYFGPCSPYGGQLEKNVAVAMTFGVDFKEGASDFGHMLILKGNDALPTWGLSRGVVLMTYPDAIKLGKVQNNEVVELAAYTGTLEKGKNYNLEFIAIDNGSGTTDIYVKIMDENGKLLAEDGNNSGFTMLAKNVEGVAGEGYVTMFSNGANAEQYRFGTGKFTAPEDDKDDENPSTGYTVPFAAMVTLALSAATVLLMKKRVK